MKRRFFSILVFSVLFLFVLNLKGDIDYTSNPVVGIDNSSFTKWVDVPTGEETWGYTWGRTAHIFVSAGMKGVGEGQGTLTNISIPGILRTPLGTYQDKEDKAGTTDENGHGSYNPGDGIVDTTYPVSLAPDAKDGDSWDWSSGGYTVIWPWEWHKTTAWGVQVSIPGNVAGRYTTAGGWQKGTTIRRDATGNSGSITVNFKYKCSGCISEGDAPSDVCAGSEMITCERSCGCEGESADSGSGYGCSQSDYYDWCNDAGTCSVGSSYGVPGPECGQNYCCCDHNDSGSGSVSGLSGPSSALAGESVTIGLSTNTAFSQVYWYVAGPGASGLGSHIETDTGGSSSTTESFTYTFGSSDSGDYVITAYIYNYTDPSSYDVPSTYELSHTVSVSHSDSGSGGSTAPSNSGSGCFESVFGDYCNAWGSCSVNSAPGVRSPSCGENWCCCSNP